MADKNEFDDEYRFEGLEGFESHEETNENTPQEKPVELGESNAKKRGIIVIGVLVGAILVYKFVGSYLTNKDEVIQQGAMPAVATTPVPAMPAIVNQAPLATPVASSALDEKMAAMQLSQQAVRDEVASLESKLGGLSNQLADLSSKMTQVSNQLSALSGTLTLQEQKLAALATKPVVKRPVRRVARATVPAQSFYIQAVIPGRAWLISTNGSTITVGEGSPVPGYGVVKLIDPNQGRVVMSSGRTIRFSQTDT